MKDKFQGVPRCPNHGEPLNLSREQLTHTKGYAPCPISGCLFEFTQIPEEEIETKDKYGNVTKIKVYKVEGDD
jgi:hypothetical protein